MGPQEILALVEKYGWPMCILALVFTGWLFPKPHVNEVERSRDRCYSTQDRMMGIVEGSHGLQKETLEQIEEVKQDVRAIKVRMEARG